MSDEEKDVDIDLFEEGINEKIDSYFSSNNNELLSYQKIDDFLKYIELYDMWNSEEEKDLLWQCLMKYNIDNKVDKYGAKKGMHDLLSQEEENQKENKEDNLLTRISRMSYRNDGLGTVNKLVLNKYKQKAIDEFDCLDNSSLIQFKKIFVLLKINENNKNIISIDKIDEICNKHKFIKLEKNEIIRYLSFLTCESKPIEEITSLNINNDIFYEIDSLLQEKILDEDYDKYEEDEEEEDNENEKKEDPIEIIEDILQKIEITKDNTMVLKDMKNNLLKLNVNMGDTINKIVQDNADENQQENISNIESLNSIINEKMEKFDEFFQNLNKEQNLNIKRIYNLKKSIISFNNDMNTLKEDYKTLYEKYNNNQELEVDEEMERLLDENVALNQELNLKKEEIGDLINERAEKDKQINELYIKLEEDQKVEKELRKQISELKILNNKKKEEYENLMDNVVNKIEKKENEEKRERQKIKEMIEKQIKNEEDKKNGNNINSEQSGQIQIKELNNIDNMDLPLTEKLLKKKKILSQLPNEQLMEYVLKLERLNISYKSDKNKKDEKLKENEEIIGRLNKVVLSNKKEISSLNIENKKLQKKITDLQNEVKSNEIFRPSIAMNGQMRISRMSKLNTAGINAMKFAGGFKNMNKNKMNSSSFFQNDKNMNFNISGKKNIKTTKLRDKNINVQIGKEQKTKFTPQNVLYGFDDNKITEEQNEEDNEQINEGEKNNKEKDAKNKEKKNFEISNVDKSSIEGNKMPFTNLEKNGIEFDIQKTVNNIGVNEVITIDNINDINLGGEDMIEINKEGDNNSDLNNNGNKTSQHQITQSFFESKPLENNIDIFEKKTDLDIIQSNKSNNYKETQNKIYGGIFSNNPEKIVNPSTELYDEDIDRETIQVNANQNIGGGLEDMIFNELENNEEINTGRESEIIKKNDLQINKYDLNIENKDKKDKKGEHNDRLKSSDNIIYTFNSKDKLNQLENNNINSINLEGNNNNKEKEDNKNKILEINNNNQINIKEEKKENKNEILEINKNNQINIKEDKKENKNKILEINKNNEINIKEENKKNNKLEINDDWVNIENDKKDDKRARKRTVVLDIKGNKLSGSKEFDIENQGNEEIKNRVRIKSLKIPNSNKAMRKKNGFVSLEDLEIENNNYDYYSLYHEDFVKNKLNELKDKGNEKNIYSDQIYLLSDKKKLEKRLILLTPSNIYIIESKDANFVLIINKNEINKIVISNQNLNILSFMKNNGVNILLLTLRRMDLLYYLREHYRKTDKPLRFVYQDEFKVMVKGKECILSVKDKIFTTLSNFDGAIKIGYLLKLSPYIFRVFSQRLVVLTSIGLIVFDDPTKPPERLYPIIGSHIEKVLPEKYKRANCFEIITLSGEVKVFAAYKEREMNSWLEEFKKVKDDFKKKMKKLDTTNKIEFMDNQNSLFNVKEEENEEELIRDSKNAS